VTIVDCASANLGSACGQIDYLDTSGTYCGVKVQNCYGTCGGGTPPTGAPPTGTPPATGTPIVVNACVGIRIYKKEGATFSTTPMPQNQLGSLRVGDVIRLAVRGNNATFKGGRFIVKVGGSEIGIYDVTASLPLAGDPATREFIYDYQIGRGGSYTIEGYVSITPPGATVTPEPVTSCGGTCTSNTECSSGAICAAVPLYCPPDRICAAMVVNRCCPPGTGTPLSGSGGAEVTIGAAERSREVQ